MSAATTTTTGRLSKDGSMWASRFVRTKRAADRFEAKLRKLGCKSVSVLKRNRVYRVRGKATLAQWLDIFE